MKLENNLNTNNESTITTSFDEYIEKKKGKKERLGKTNIVTIDDCPKLPLLMLGSLLSATILAPILQVLVVFAGFFFDIIGFFIGVGEPGDSWVTKTEDFFFYATFKEAYIYGVALLWSAVVWMNGGNAKGILLVLRYIVTILSCIAAICLPHLFISTIIGPIFIIFGLAYRAKR